jgi:5-methylcytosine-specific restriction endonuclease McrA
MTVIPSENEAKLIRRARYLANRETALAQMKLYRDSNREKIRIQKKIDYQENREIRLLQMKEYAKKKPEVNKAAVRRYQEKNRELSNARATEWRRNNPDLRKKIVRSWEQANPDKRAASARRRRAASFKAEGSHTTADIQNIRREQRNMCAYCQCKLGRKGHLDHIVPLSRKGSNWPSNLQWLCAPCNLSKGAKDPTEFARSLGLLL